MDWRLIEYGVGNPFHNMACDEAIFTAFCEGSVPPTVRFYGWDRPSISLGYLQKAEGPVHPAECERRGIAVVRRPTGGRAVAHGRDFTFSVVLDNQSAGGRGGISASYLKTSKAVIRALQALGIDAEMCSTASSAGAVKNTVNCFNLSLENEVAVCGIKVLGCAQMRRGNSILQQNSLALSSPACEVMEAQRSLTFYGIVSPSMQDISRALKKAVEEEFDVQLVPGDLSYREKQLLERLESKYRDPERNMKRAANRTYV